MKDMYLPEQGNEDSLRQYAFNLQRYIIEKVAAELHNCELDIVPDNEEESIWRAGYKKKSKDFEIT